MLTGSVRKRSEDKKFSVQGLIFALLLCLLLPCASACTQAASDSTEGSIGLSQTTADAAVAEEETTLTLEEALSVIPDYAGEPYAEVNENRPYFEAADLTTASYESYSELDALGRCGVAMACIGRDIMPTEARGSISSVTPTGWQSVTYDIIDDSYLYNRCHLIAYELAAENANEKNLITGTRYMNVQGMLPFENMVADYIYETENHVLYRVTPLFDGDNLVADGVLMEAMSVEDEGEGILFCVYCYNVQPGIVIDYATGDNYQDENYVAEEDGTEETEDTSSGTENEDETEISEDPESGETTDDTTAESEDASSGAENEDPETAEADSGGTTYILNTNTMKFHYPSCESVSKMSEKNKQEYTGDREDLISQGYEPCKNCNP